MRSSLRQHIFDSLIREWGVSKSVQILLLAAAAASITIVIGANALPNKTIIEKESIDNEY